WIKISSPLETIRLSLSTWILPLLRCTASFSSRYKDGLLRKGGLRNTNSNTSGIFAHNSLQGSTRTGSSVKFCFLMPWRHCQNNLRKKVLRSIGLPCYIMQHGMHGKRDK